MSDPLDVSGDWLGVYNYEGGPPPVAFRASLTEAEGRISGATEEPGPHGRPLVASLAGRRAQSGVTWLKTYKDREHPHDVSYEGALSADGQEISGRWSIYGDGSGTFLMVRQPKAAAVAERSFDAQA